MRPPERRSVYVENGRRLYFESLESQLECAYPERSSRVRCSSIYAMYRSETDRARRGGRYGI